MTPLLLASIALGCSAAVTYLLTPVTSRLAVRLGVLDHPDRTPQGRKKHDSATPYLGGIAILAGLTVGSGALLLRDQMPPLNGVPAALALSAVLAGLGLADDIRQLPRVVRLVVQISAAAAAWSVGFKVLATPWGAVNLIITIVWIVGITNAFNLLDNMDGLSAGLAAVSAFSFAGMGLLNGQGVIAVSAAALAGAAAGFLAHNRHPAKVFMGDAGSLMIGFLLALIGIKLQFDNLVKITFFVPVVVLGLPIFDTTLVVASRIANGRRPFTGGADHISHRLVHVGLPVRAAVGLLYWSGLCLGWLGFVISRSSVEVGYMLLGFVLAVGAFFGALLWRVPVYEESRAGLGDDPRLP
jgi:UDP-GlcNAc:undecaprenyl-phosphate/decaprenyl-phosphate GlcNAc-1-phosphate transferase